MAIFEGTLKITKTKKGHEHKFCFQNAKGKQVEFVIPESQRFYSAAAQDGDAANAEVEGSIVTKCTVPGKEAEPAAAPPKRQPQSVNVNNGKNSASVRPHTDQARHPSPRVAWGMAPYNFVPYEVGQVMPPVEDEERVWSGRLICSLTALTPLLVSRGAEKGDSGPSHCRFMQVNGRNVIPGTSLKGMIRSLMEILSYSGLRPMNREKLFWRVVISQDYRDLFPGEPKGGFLVKKGADYELRPALVSREKHGAPIKVETGKRPRLGTPAIYYFEPDVKASSLPLENREIVQRLWRQMTPDQETRWQKKITDWLKGQNTPGLPVFFREEGGRIAELGFCRFFRIEYKYSPYDLAWPEDNSDAVKDMALSIFGHVKKEGALRGRVAIEACEINGTPLGQMEPVVLGEPKPTCLPFYLDQANSPVDTDRSGNNKLDTMENYNEAWARLRGRKLYWHQEPVTQDLKKLQNDNVKSILHPLDRGAHGNFVIHVEGLTDSELGCLLEALELKPGCAHKLGMGKPLGYGSIRLTVERAEICDLREKYRSLAGRLNARVPLLDEAARDALREKFRRRVFDFARKKAGDARNFYELPSIKALYLMLNWERKPGGGLVSYMPLGCFKKHPLLPKPDSIGKVKACK